MCPVAFHLSNHTFHTFSSLWFPQVNLSINLSSLVNWPQNKHKLIWGLYSFFIIHACASQLQGFAEVVDTALWDLMEYFNGKILFQSKYLSHIAIWCWLCQTWLSLNSKNVHYPRSGNSPRQNKFRNLFVSETFKWQNIKITDVFFFLIAILCYCLLELWWYRDTGGLMLIPIVTAGVL